MRAFAALPLDGATRGALAGVVRRLDAHAGESVRWVGTKQLHLTLRFLGEIDEPTADRVRERLSALAPTYPAPTLSVRGLGAFPPRGSPRVVWAGLDGDVTGLVELAAAVEAACGSCGVPAEVRAFRPHVTLGRVRRGQRAPAPLARALREEVETRPFRPEEILLFRSILGPGGAVHEAVGRFPLGVP